MAEEEQGQEKSEMPTARRRRKARQEGSVAKSTEVDNAFFLLFTIIIFKAAGPFMMRKMKEFVSHSLLNAHNEVSMQNMQNLLEINVEKFLIVLFPFAITMILVAFMSSYLQIGWLWSTKALQPKWGQVFKFRNPFGRMLRIEGMQNLVKDLLKIVFIGLISYLLLRREVNNMMNLIDMSVDQIFAYLTNLIIKLLIYILLLYIGIAAGDYALTRFIYIKKLKMTKSEIKDERRQMEGDPQVKSKMRSMMLAESRKRMMADVPKADVVITNPVHLAIALKYDPQKFEAPYVIAKGKRLIAEKIKEIAREHNIPIIEDKVLARMLYKTSRIGQQISTELYAAVAEIIAQVYKMKNKKVL